MVRIIMNGCNGHMGQVIAGLAAQDPEVEMVAGIDLEDKGLYACPVFTDIEKCDVPADVMIDFSSAKATDGVLEYCRSRKLPLVLCTTGLSEEQIRKVEETAKETAVLRSANMSLGINTLLKLIQEAAKVLAAAGFDTEQLWLWQTVLMRLWTTSTIMYMTEARREKREIRRKSVFLQ